MQGSNFNPPPAQSGPGRPLNSLGFSRHTRPSFGTPLAMLLYMVNAAKGRFFALLLLPLLLVGCGKGDESRAVAELGTGDIRWAAFPVELKVDTALLTDSDAYDDLNKAITYWEAKAGKPLFVVKGPWDSSSMGLPYSGSPANPDSLADNVIFFQSPWPFDPSIRGKTIVHSNEGSIENSVVLLSASSHYCSGNCLGDTTSVSRRKLIAHELGHFIGFGHSSSASDLMYPEILTYEALDSLKVDSLLLEKLTN